MGGSKGGVCEINSTKNRSLIDQSVEEIKI